MREKRESLKQEKQRSLPEPPVIVGSTSDRDETGSSPSVAAMSQREFCQYLAEDPSNVGAKARRRGLSAEDYLRTIALERKGENWERQLERPNKARWVRVEE